MKSYSFCRLVLVRFGELPRPRWRKNTKSGAAEEVNHYLPNTVRFWFTHWTLISELRVKLKSLDKHLNDMF